MSLVLVKSLSPALKELSSFTVNEVGSMQNFESKRKVSVASRRVWVYFVTCMSKQSTVIGSNSALVLYVVHFLFND